MNKEACDSIGVPKDVSDLVLPMGCTMHMDGSVLSSITKIAFLYGVFGMDFSGAGTYGMAIVVAILSAFVLSGAPGGGLVGEMLIVSMFNFPAEAFPIIATLGFLFDPAATCLNASGDTIASMLVTRLVEGKEWLAKAAAAKRARSELHSPLSVPSIDPFIKGESAMTIINTEHAPGAIGPYSPGLRDQRPCHHLRPASGEPRRRRHARGHRRPGRVEL